MSLFKLESVCFTYTGSDIPAIDKLSIEINEGESVAILGANGSGKTTFLNIISGRAFTDETNGDITGKFLVNSREVTFQSRFEHPLDRFFDYRIGKLFRDSYLETSTRTVKELVHSLVQEITKEECKSIPLLAETIMHTFELSRVANRALDTLSTGEKKRVIAALKLAEDPDIILIDEFRYDLDFDGQKWLMSLINTFITMGKTVIMTENTPANIQPFIKRVIAISESFDILRDGTQETVIKDKKFLIESGLLPVEEEKNFCPQVCRNISNDINPSYLTLSDILRKHVNKE